MERAVMKRAWRNTLAASLKVVAVMTAGVLISGTAEARLFVLKSDVAAYPAQSVIEPGQKLNLPKGKRLTVLLPDGSTRDLTSANNGPVQALLQATKPASWWDDLVKMVLSGGGTDKPGSVRSVGTPPASLAVEGIRGGTARVCVERGAVPTVTRDRSADQQVVNFLAGTSDKPAVAEFAAGERTLKWPPGLEVVDGQTYRLQPVNGTGMQVQVVLIAKVPPGAEAVQSLAGAGCLPQAAAALRGLAAK
jgi:hypothetical protein